MTALGGPEVLELRDVERPEPIPTEVLVRVTAAGINPVDWKTRQRGGYREAVGEPPLILGWDVAGVVEEVDPDVTRFAPGDRVFGMPWFPRVAGGYAEYVTSPARQLARTPDALGDEQAGGLPLAGLTAWQALVDVAKVGEGTRVLVHAAAGGVGHLAVQIAKARGAHVIGTAREEKHDFLRDLGVDEPIDYTAGPFEEAVSDVDVVLDLVAGSDYGLRSLQTLRRGRAAGSASRPTCQKRSPSRHGSSRSVRSRFWWSPTTPGSNPSPPSPRRAGCGSSSTRPSPSPKPPRRIGASRTAGRGARSC